MRLKLLRLLATIGCFLFIIHPLSAQTCLTNINGTVVNLGCNQTCSDLNFQIPHIKGTDDYTIINSSYTPYPYTTATGIVQTEIYIDDKFSHLLSLPFPACIYGSTFNNFVIGSNGLITFDATQADCGNGWSLETSIGSGVPVTIPFTGAQTCSNATGPKYPPYSIMAPYQDIDPSVTSGTPNRKIEWRIEGAAPCRRLVVSFYRIALFGDNSKLDTYQIVVYESSGIVEVYIEQKSRDTNGGSPWNSDFAILGIQKDNTKAKAVAGRNCTAWTENNKAYKFIPSSGGSRYVVSELYTLGGALVATADTTTTVTGLIDLRFLNICPPPGNNTYIVKTIFTACENAANQLITFDTVYVNRNALNATATTTNTGCGAPSGTIAITIPVGVGTLPFTYVLDAGAPVIWPSRSYTFNNVAAGPHTVTITDASGCTTILNVTVIQTSVLTANALPTSTSCSGANNGQIAVTPNGGTAPYTFTLNPGAIVQVGNTALFTGLAAGPYTVTVSDISGCVTSPAVSVTVAAGSPVTANVVPTATTCSGAANGRIDITSASGTGPNYTFSLDGGVPLVGTIPYTFSNLSAGSHTILVTDQATGCVSTLYNVTVAAGPVLTANVAPTATTCSGATNGRIDITSASGTGPNYIFSLDGGAPQMGTIPYTFSNLSAGSHTILVTDQATGCVSTLYNVTVAAGPMLTATTSANATSCNGASNGSITVTPTNGAAPYTFSLDGGAPIGAPAPYTFNNVVAGPHTIVVSSAAGCSTNTINVDVPVGPTLTTTAGESDVLCNGGATGTITVAQPAPGTAPYQYSLDGVTWQGSNLFTGLAAGVYTVYFRDVNGCQNSLSITINEPATLTATTATTAVVCNGQNNGIINVTTGGGVTPYQYSIDGGATWQAGNIFNVIAGNYTVTIKDANNCITTQNVTVTEPAPLTASSANSNASCDGGNDGVITVNAAGGNSGYTYSIDGVTYQPSNIFNVAPGNYTITVKDNLGCNTTFNTTVGLTNNLTFTPQTDPTICEGTSAQLQLVSNATVYSWTPATGLSNTTISNPVANPTVTTPYTVTATLGRCSANDIVIVNVNAAPIPDAGPPGFICYGQSYQLQGSGGVQYTWTPSTYLSSPSVANPVSTPIKTITYTLSLVIDAIGCKSLITDQVTVDVTPPIKVNTFPYDTIGYPGDQFQLNATSLANIYSWSPATGLSNPNIPNPVVTVGPIGNDVLYQVIASTAAGCKGEGYVHVRVYTGPDIYMPTGFTPNNDGKNDKFTPFPVGISEIKYFRVFNRWGQMLFSTSKLNDGWDGKLMGAEQPTGVYVWMVQGVTKAGRLITKKGTVTLIR